MPRPYNGNMAKKILFTSIKGGVGVTTVCCGVGLALAERGHRTLVLDGAKEYCAALISLGLANMQVYTLADFERGACRAKQTVVAHPKCTNFLISSAVGVKDAETFARATADLDGLFDYILLDRAAGSPCDEAIIVTEPYAPSIKAADACRSALKDGNIGEVSLIVNRFSAAQFVAGEIAGTKKIAAAMRLPLKGVIAEDLTLSAGRCKASTRRYFSAVAEIIAGTRVDLPDPAASFLGLNGFIKRKMRERL